MPTYQYLTDRSLAQSTAITPTTIIHIVTTADTTQSVYGSSYKAELQQLIPIFSGSTFSGGSGNCITDLYISNLYGCSPITVWDNLTLSGSVIDSQGGGYLDLRYGNSDGRFYIGNDNGGYSDTFIQGENGYLEISAYDPAARIAMFTDGGNAGFVLTNDTSFFSTDINLYTDTTSIVSTPVAGDGNNKLEINNDNIFLKGNSRLNITVGNHNPVGIGSAVSDLLIVVVTGTSYTTDSLRETNPSILSSQYSTIQTGIKNSVALGGYNLNVNTDNTAYVDNLNINTVGSGTSILNLGIDSNGNVVSGSTFTGNTSATCIPDLYVSTIHSCSPLNINPLDEGNVYFGSTSGVTIDVTNSRLGIGTETPQYPLEILSSGSTFYYDPNSAGGRFNLSGNTGIPRFDVSVAGSGTRISSGGSVGVRNWNDSTWTGYGEVGDMFMYAGNETYGLNFINPPGTNQGTRPTEDYIRFYAGQSATGTADIHIQGSGTTRGFVGIGTELPTEKLHISGGDMLVENTNGKYYTDIQNATGPLTILSGNSSGVSRIGVIVPTFDSVTLGVRGPSAVFPGYGKQGDAFIYSSNANNGFNLISTPGTGTDDYIRFYSGQDANGTIPDIHIQGSGSTRGFVGIGTSSPTEKLEVSGKTKTTNFQMTSGGTSGYVLTSDASGNASWQSMYGYQYYSAITITSAQTLLIGSSPVEILPAPGANKYYDFKVFFEYIFNTTSYVSTGKMELHDSTTKRVSNRFDFNGQLSNNILISDMNAASELMPINSKLEFTTSDGTNPTLGDSSFKVKIYYNIIDFG